MGPPKDQQESLPGLMIYYTNLEERSSFSLGVVKLGAAVCSQVLICKQQEKTTLDDLSREEIYEKVTR